MLQDSKSLFLKVKDHSVTGEKFELHYNSDEDMLITFPKPADLDRYYESNDYVSHTDGRRSLIEKLYHIVKSFSLKSKVNLINRLHEKGNLLDIGAGTGDFLQAAEKNGWHATGFEPNSRAMTLASEKGVNLISDVTTLKSASYDIITLWHVLEHVPDLHDQIKTIKKLLKPDGYVLIAVPNFNSFDAKYYKEFWAAYDVPRHLWHFSRKAISRLFSIEDMIVQEVIPMKFDSFYVSMLSEKYKAGKLNYIKAVWIGLKSNIIAGKTGEYSSHIYIIKNKKPVSV